MKKKIVFMIFFIILATGVLVFIANEYLKRLEKKTIERYVKSIQNELKEYSVDTTISQVECKGFIKHTCSIDDAKVLNVDIELKNIKLAIQNISHNNIRVSIDTDIIKKDNYKNPYLSLLPNRFNYTLNIHSVDSKLGFVMLKRTVYLDFGTFDINADFDVLLRENGFRNTNIFYILKEWFNKANPNFYEYSLDNLTIKMQSKKDKAKNTKIINALKTITNNVNKKQLNNKLILKYFNELMNNSYKVINNEIKQITLDVTRKNPNITFFNLLSNEAATKGSLGIIEIINSINETYNINLE